MKSEIIYLFVGGKLVCFFSMVLSASTTDSIFMGCSKIHRSLRQVATIVTEDVMPWIEAFWKSKHGGFCFHSFHVLASETQNS